MPAHLRPLPRCRTCRAPATQMLYNATNAPTGEYCERHARHALDKFMKDSPDQRPAWEKPRSSPKGQSEETPRVVDLMEALEASLAAVKKTHKGTDRA